MTDLPDAVEQREIAEWNDWACKKNQELFRQAEAERDAALARNAECPNCGAKP